MTQLGTQAMQAAASGVSFGSASKVDQRAFMKKQMVKATINKATGILQQAEGHDVQALVQKSQADIASFNMDHLRTSEAIKSSNLRLQQAYNVENIQSQDRELSYQQDLLKLKKANAVTQQGFTAARGELLSERFGLLDERFAVNAQREGLLGEQFGSVDAQEGLLAQRAGLIDQREGILGQRFGANAQRQGLLGQRVGINAQQAGIVQQRMGINQQRYGIVDANEQVELQGAQNKFTRTSIGLNMQADRARFAYEAEGINLFRDDVNSQNAFQQGFINLAGQRLGEQFGYNENSMNNWYGYQAGLSAYDQAELRRFRGMETDEYNMNVRLGGIYQTMNGAGLSAATGMASQVGGNTAAWLGYMGAAGHAVDLGSIIYDWMKT